MKTKYPPEWRTQSAWKKKFYARYMKWLERLGYLVVAAVIGAFIFAFNYRVDDVISADKVQIMATVYPLQASRQVYVVQALVEDFSEVNEGQEVLEVIDGEVAIDEYLAWMAIEKTGQAHSFDRPVPIKVVADKSGVFVAAADIVGRTVESGEELGQIRDYEELVLTAKLGGQGVANAQAGGVATLKSISVSSENGILVRGETGGDAIVSGRLIPAETKDEIASVLIGSPLNVRDDVSLELTGISKLEVDAQLELQSGSGDGIQIDPLASTKLKADVLSGEHTATVQFAKLSPSVQEQVNRLIADSLEGKLITGLDGQSRLIARADNFNTVFQVSATPGAGETGKFSIPGTAINRNFEAKLRIQSPPAYLVNAVRHADAEGQMVTVKVELKTGDRPIATLLLKRS